MSRESMRPRAAATAAAAPVAESGQALCTFRRRTPGAYTRPHFGSTQALCVAHGVHLGVL
jgi:hypothetical protein